MILRADSVYWVMTGKPPERLARLNSRLGRVNRFPHAGVTLRALAAGILALCLVTACGIADRLAAASPKPTVSPSPDELAARFVDLVHSYWVDLIKADGNAPIVCLNGPIQPSECEARATAQLGVQQKFLQDLENTPAPPQFAAPDKVLLDEVPKAIADLEVMIATARTGNKDALVRATSIYVSEMEPRITDALDAIDTSMIHQR